MHFQPDDIPSLTPDHGSGGMRSIRAGATNMEIGYSWCRTPVDTGPFYKGLPDDTCPCDHYGYVKSGSFRVIYTDGSQELIEDGSVYFIPKGHHFIYDEACELIEFNPHDQLQQLMQHFNVELAKVAEEGDVDSYKPKR
ncbi:MULTISPECIES: hypothetical protein [Mycobacterium]|uniref:Cupin domain-containing protein n=1 Tax=Mycobacterium colombiense TaxID=339268 RepID=A0A1A0VNS4_9MYCO|nr:MULTISPECIES: hypothetical protein [Mycobacterium]OBB84846.1 hypothetical protein A5760_09180 [Mycobacterium colombiense]OBC00448.1 hypothetical protein A5782_01555 [Mycobacterium sp. 852002-40037_SCH5390672]